MPHKPEDALAAALLRMAEAIERNEPALAREEAREVAAAHVYLDHPSVVFLAETVGAILADVQGWEKIEGDEDLIRTFSDLATWLREASKQVPTNEAFVKQQVDALVKFRFNASRLRRRIATAPEKKVRR